jgi:alpha-D-ribose 1-methylphosphonate 5-triphosphate synthase subunit PhnG
MPQSTIEARRRWMGVLAKAEAGAVAAVWARLAPGPEYEMLRRPEFGLVMVRGRIGGDGGAFNLGEMTVTRCSVRLAGGLVGHAWIAGRHPDQAEQAAIIDALMQDPLGRGRIEPEIDRLAARHAARSAEAATKAAATRVEFFTMVRGED